MTSRRMRRSLSVKGVFEMRGRGRGREGEGRGRVGCRLYIS